MFTTYSTGPNNIRAGLAMTELAFLRGIESDVVGVEPDFESMRVIAGSIGETLTNQLIVIRYGGEQWDEELPIHTSQRNRPLHLYDTDQLVVPEALREAPANYADLERYASRILVHSITQVTIEGWNSSPTELAVAYARALITDQKPYPLPADPKAVNWTRRWGAFAAKTLLRSPLQESKVSRVTREFREHGNKPSPFKITRRSTA